MNKATFFLLIFWISSTHSICQTKVRKFEGYVCVHNDPIGMGSRGTIYLVSDGDKQYILKVQDKSYTSKKELENLTIMQGASYVVQLKEHVSTWDQLYMILSYGSQGTVEDVMNHTDYFEDIDNTFSFFRKVAQALSTIHQRGLVHADLKGDNVVVDENNDPLIIDFDSSMLIGEQATARGTIDFMSPEMVRGFEERVPVVYNPEMDLYSLGALFYAVVKHTLPTHLLDFSYLEIMTAPIKFKKGDNQIFFDIAFGLLQPVSKRLSLQKVSDMLENAAFQTDSSVIPNNVVYKLTDYANEDEQPSYPNQLLLYVLLTLCILFVIFVIFFLKKCLVKPEPESLLIDPMSDKNLKSPPTEKTLSVHSN